MDKGFGCGGCGCGSILLVLVVVCLVVSGVVGSQAVALGDQPLTTPHAAAQSGLTWNQLLADREAAKKESQGWNSNCDLAVSVGLFFGAPAYIIYPMAGNDPAGREGFWGKQIMDSDWDAGFVPMNIPLPEGIFRAYQGFYWNTMASGASSGHGLSGGCKLRPVQRPNAGIGF